MIRGAVRVALRMTAFAALGAPAAAQPAGAPAPDPAPAPLQSPAPAHGLARPPPDLLAPGHAVPGQHPFVIPRGLCESGPPVQSFPARAPGAAAPGADAQATPATGDTR